MMNSLNSLSLLAFLAGTLLLMTAAQTGAEHQRLYLNRSYFDETDCEPKSDEKCDYPSVLCSGLRWINALTERHCYIAGWSSAARPLLFFYCVQFRCQLGYLLFRLLLLPSPVQWSN
ncbi:hypothetical protein V5799_011840 [Amblyomma americanum]|uniref:Secreted protein n=1 Tax=Amblyomma americanum TaxID=6943 RepID=A0AAQ4EFR6_AMBAM